MQIRILLPTYKYFCSITWGRDFLSLLTFWSFQSPVFTSWALWMLLFRGNSYIRDRREKTQKSRKTRGEKHNPLKPISRGKQEQRGVCAVSTSHYLPELILSWTWDLNLDPSSSYLHLLLWSITSAWFGHCVLTVIITVDPTAPC